MLSDSSFCQKEKWRLLILNRFLIVNLFALLEFHSHFQKDSTSIWNKSPFFWPPNDIGPKIICLPSSSDNPWAGVSSPFDSVRTFGKLYSRLGSPSHVLKRPLIEFNEWAISDKIMSTRKTRWRVSESKPVLRWQRAGHSQAFQKLKSFQIRIWIRNQMVKAFDGIRLSMENENRWRIEHFLRSKTSYF